jgi:hypothetical protein
MSRYQTYEFNTLGSNIKDHPKQIVKNMVNYPVKDYNKFFSDILISAHGKQDDTVFELPKNVRVVLMCQPETVSCAIRNDLIQFLISSYPFGSNLSIINYLSNLFDHQTTNSQFCIYSGNIPNHKIIPNIVFVGENKKFRSGIFNLPIKFQRIFIEDYVSKTENTRFSPGDIINIDMKGFGERVVANSIYKNKLDYQWLNNLENMIVKPNFEDNIENIRKIKSFVIPHRSYYNPIPDTYFDLKTYIYDNYREDKITTIFVNACRNGLTNPPSMQLSDYVIDGWYKTDFYNYFQDIDFALSAPFYNHSTYEMNIPFDQDLKEYTTINLDILRNLHYRPKYRLQTYTVTNSKEDY